MIPPGHVSLVDLDSICSGGHQPAQRRAQLWRLGKQVDWSSSLVDVSRIGQGPMMLDMSFEALHHEDVQRLVTRGASACDEEQKNPWESRREQCPRRARAMWMEAQSMMIDPRLLCVFSPGSTSSPR